MGISSRKKLKLKQLKAGSSQPSLKGKSQKSSNSKSSSKSNNNHPSGGKDASFQQVKMQIKNDNGNGDIGNNATKVSGASLSGNTNNATRKLKTMRKKKQKIKHDTKVQEKIDSIKYQASKALIKCVKVVKTFLIQKITKKIKEKKEDKNSPEGDMISLLSSLESMKALNHIEISKQVYEKYFKEDEDSDDDASKDEGDTEARKEKMEKSASNYKSSEDIIFKTIVKHQKVSDIIDGYKKKLADFIEEDRLYRAKKAEEKGKMVEGKKMSNIFKDVSYSDSAKASAIFIDTLNEDSENEDDDLDDGDEDGDNNGRKKTDKRVVNSLESSRAKRKASNNSKNKNDKPASGPNSNSNSNSNKKRALESSDGNKNRLDYFNSNSKFDGITKNHEGDASRLKFAPRVTTYSDDRDFSMYMPAHLRPQVDPSKSSSNSNSNSSKKKNTVEPALHIKFDGDDNAKEASVKSSISKPATAVPALAAYSAKMGSVNKHKSELNNRNLRDGDFIHGSNKSSNSSSKVKPLHPEHIDKEVVSQGKHWKEGGIHPSWAAKLVAKQQTVVIPKAGEKSTGKKIVFDDD